MTDGRNRLMDLLAEGFPEAVQVRGKGGPAGGRAIQPLGPYINHVD